MTGGYSEVEIALDASHGALSDVARLRAYAKTYSKRGRISNQLGRTLAKRIGPKLHVVDLGRVRLNVGDRTVELSGMTLAMGVAGILAESIPSGLVIAFFGALTALAGIVGAFLPAVRDA